MYIEVLSQNKICEFKNSRIPRPSTKTTWKPLQYCLFFKALFDPYMPYYAKNNHNSLGFCLNVYPSQTQAPPPSLPLPISSK